MQTASLKRIENFLVELKRWKKIVSIGYFVSFREKTVTVAGLPTRRVYDVSQMCQMTHIFEIREKKNWCNDLLVLQLQLTVNTIQKRQNAIISSATATDSQHHPKEAKRNYLT